MEGQVYSLKYSYKWYLPPYDSSICLNTCHIESDIHAKTKKKQKCSRSILMAQIEQNTHGSLPII